MSADAMREELWRIFEKLDEAKRKKLLEIAAKLSNKKSENKDDALGESEDSEKRDSDEWTPFEVLDKYAGIWKNVKIDPIKYQKEMRDEWN